MPSSRLLPATAPSSRDSSLRPVYCAVRCCIRLLPAVSCGPSSMASQVARCLAAWLQLNQLERCRVRCQPGVRHDAHDERALPSTGPEALELLQPSPRRRPVLRRLRRAADVPAVLEDGARTDGAAAQRVVASAEGLRLAVARW